MIQRGIKKRAAETIFLKASYRNVAINEMTCLLRKPLLNWNQS
jgi:hypothetical protein